MATARPRQSRPGNIGTAAYDLDRKGRRPKLDCPRATSPKEAWDRSDAINLHFSLGMTS